MKFNPNKKWSRKVVTISMRKRVFIFSRCAENYGVDKLWGWRWPPIFSRIETINITNTTWVKMGEEENTWALIVELVGLFEID